MTNSEKDPSMRYIPVTETRIEQAQAALEQLEAKRSEREMKFATEYRLEVKLGREAWARIDQILKMIRMRLPSIMGLLEYNTYGANKHSSYLEVGKSHEGSLADSMDRILLSLESVDEGLRLYVGDMRITCSRIRLRNEDKDHVPYRTELSYRGNSQRIIYIWNSEENTLEASQPHSYSEQYEIDVAARKLWRALVLTGIAEIDGDEGIFKEDMLVSAIFKAAKLELR